MIRRKTSYRLQQRLQAFEPVIHGYEQSDDFLAANTPSLSPFLTQLWPIGPLKAAGINGAMYDTKPFRTDVVIPLKMPGDHVTVDHDQRRIAAKILLFFQPSERPMGQIQFLDKACGSPN